MLTVFKSILPVGIFFIFIACSKSVDQQKEPETAAPSSVAKENDDEQRKVFHAEMQGHLNNANFSELDRIAAELTKTKERFPGGDWKLYRFYLAIAAPPGGPEPVKERVDFNDRISKLTRWTAEKPDSIFANVALAKAQIGYAWELRGSGFAREVSEQELADFQEGLKRADETLNTMSAQRKDCVAWYTAKQSIGIGLGWDVAEMNRLLEEAISLEPLYHQVYERHAYYLLPRWHGAAGEWEKFAETASSKMGGIEGSILYSDICWHMSRYYRGQEFFLQNHVNWLRIKKGFTDRQKQYGASIRYLNAFCLLASSAGDKTTARALLTRIGDRWERDFWIEQKYFDAAKKWAFE
jgi:hypothetical protein